MATIRKEQVVPVPPPVKYVLELDREELVVLEHVLHAYARNGYQYGGTAIVTQLHKLAFSVL